MACTIARKSMATSLAALLISGASASAFATPATATLEGTVLASGSTPLAGAVVSLTDDAGKALTSAITGPDGSFRIDGATPGRATVSIAAEGTSYDVATPITLAPGQTRSVHLALRAGDDDKKKKKGGGTYWTGGAKGAMIAVLVGFAAAGAVGISQAGDDNSTQPSASPSNPND